jgi:hypothetical protein
MIGWNRKDYTIEKVYFAGLPPTTDELRSQLTESEEK